MTELRMTEILVCCLLILIEVTEMYLLTCVLLVGPQRHAAAHLSGPGWVLGPAPALHRWRHHEVWPVAADQGQQLEERWQPREEGEVLCYPRHREVKVSSIQSSFMQFSSSKGQRCFVCTCWVIRFLQNIILQRIFMHPEIFNTHVHDCWTFPFIACFACTKHKSNP